jgi:hypothetical protein
MRSSPTIEPNTVCDPFEGLVQACYNVGTLNFDHVGGVPMYWATTTFDVTGWSEELGGALRAWADHIAVAHPKVAATRCYRFNGGTTVVWQEGFANFRDYQDLIEEEDDICAGVMAAVFQHMVPGTRRSQIWSDAI